MKKIFIILSLLCLLAALFLLAAKVRDVSFTKRSFLKTYDKEKAKLLVSPFTHDFKDADIENLLQGLSESSGITFDIFYEVEAADAERSTYNFRFRGTDLKEVLWFLSKRCQLRFKWSNAAGMKMTVRVLDPKMKKTKTELGFGVIFIGLLILVMVMMVVRKRGIPRSERYVENIHGLSESQVISRMFNEKKNDFIFQVLALDKIGESETLEARNALIESLTSSDMLVRKIAYAKLRKRYDIESLTGDVTKITDNEVKKIRRLVLADINKEWEEKHKKNLAAKEREEKHNQ